MVVGSVRPPAGRARGLETRARSEIDFASWSADVPQYPTNVGESLA
jgi:hypothetical protein